MRRLLLVLVCSVSFACRALPAGAPSGPYLVVLGTSQDAGTPQLACRCERCEGARRDPSRRRLAASGLLVDPRSGRRWLFDATPDLREQVELARDHGGPPPDAGGRPPLFDGIFLTHAHIGHYAGLVHLGREAYATEATPLYATASMGTFLKDNGPWSLLFEEDRLRHVPVAPGAPVRLADDLTVTPLAVPHRHEFSDTVAFVIEGPDRSVLYMPDIDAWAGLEPPIEELVERVDAALVDGTFFDGEELPGRDLSTIPHPFVAHTMERFADHPQAERGKLWFFHLNHSNPVGDPGSAAARRVRAAGMAVAREGDVIALSASARAIH